MKESRNQDAVVRSNTLSRHSDSHMMRDSKSKDFVKSLVEISSQTPVNEEEAALRVLSSALRNDSREDPYKADSNLHSAAVMHPVEAGFSSQNRRL